MRSMRSTATSSPSSRSISRPARAVAPSSTACATSRQPWATRWNPCQRDCGPRSPCACPSARRTRSRRRCRASRRRAAHRSGRPPKAPRGGIASWSAPSAPSPSPLRPWQSCSASVSCAPTTRSRTSRPHLEDREGAGRRPALGTGLPGLVDAPVPRQGPDVPAVGDRGEPAHLPRPVGRFAGTRRLHHGRIHPSLAPQYHGRAGGRVRLPHRRDHRHGDCLTPGRSC
jgi:hypothetical protein